MAESRELIIDVVDGVLCLTCTVNHQRVVVYLRAPTTNSSPYDRLHYFNYIRQGYTVFTFVCLSVCVCVCVHSVPLVWMGGMTYCSPRNVFEWGWTSLSLFYIFVIPITRQEVILVYCLLNSTTCNDLECAWRSFPTASLFKCDISYMWRVVRSLRISRASC